MKYTVVYPDENEGAYKTPINVCNRCDELTKKGAKIVSITPHGKSMLIFYHF